MAVLVPSGLLTIDAAEQGFQGKHNDNMTRLNDTLLNQLKYKTINDSPADKGFYAFKSADDKWVLCLFSTANFSFDLSTKLVTIKPGGVGATELVDGAVTPIKTTPAGGTTASRPTGLNRVLYMNYFDATLNKPIWWNGSNWVDATGTTV